MARIAPEDLPVIAVVGATATGKSDLGLALAHRLDGEIINADASQFYRGMDIGTAKLTSAQQAGVAHHQLDVLDVLQEATVANYQAAARADLAAIRARGRVPVVVGGSGLYVRALVDHLEIPPTDPAVRARWQDELDRSGLAALYAQLQETDPEAAARIEPRNSRRIVRALEVIELTGRPFSATLPRREHVVPTVQVGLTGARDVLADRIARRVDRMWEQGLIAEVRGLEQRGLRQGQTASRSIGYAQVLAILDGTLSEDAAREETVTATRRLVRRQEAWFAPDPRTIWLPHDAPDLIDRTVQAITGSAATARPTTPNSAAKE